MSHTHRALFWGGFGLIAILFALFFWTGTGETFFVHYDDAAYHLATAQGFVRADGPVTWQFWGSLPDGRPHNYPPLFPLLIALFIKLGAVPALAGKAAAFAGLAGGGAIFAWALKKLFGIRVAFIATLFLFLTLDFFSISLLVIPATMVVFFAPAAFYALVQRKWLALGGLLVLMFYTHMILPYVVMGGLLLWSIVYDRKKLKGLMGVLLGSVAVFLPWLIPLISEGIPYVKYWYPSLVPQARFIELNLIMLWFLGVGAWVSLRHKALEERDRYSIFFLILWVFLVPIGAFASARGLNGHAFMASVPLSALGFLFLIGRKHWVRSVAATIGALLFAGTVYLHIPLPIFESSVSVIAERSTVAEFIVKKDKKNDEGEKNVLNLIETYSAPGETIATLFDKFHDRGVAPEYENYPALYFGGRSGRPVVNAGRPEILFSEQPIEQARLVLTNVPREEWDERLEGYATHATLEAIARNFLFVGEEKSRDDVIYVYRNVAENVLRETPARSLASLNMTFVIFILLVLLVVWSLSATSPPVPRRLVSRDVAPQ